jgi:hypothetical protein
MRRLQGLFLKPIAVDVAGSDSLLRFGNALLQ